MSENSEKDNKPQVTSKGVSGTKELKVRRVHKKKAEPETEAAKTVEKEAPKAVETVKAPEAVEAPKKTVKAAKAEEPAAEEKPKKTTRAKKTAEEPAAEAPAAEEHWASERQAHCQCLDQGLGW